MVNLKTFKKTIELLKKNKTRYWVFGGYALDGIRGKITRDHEDIDIYLRAEDINKFIKLFKSLKYDCYRREQMYFIDSPKLMIGILPLTEEKKYIIANGNCTLVKYPKEIFLKDIIVSLDDFSFRIAPKEVLALDYKFSRYKNDREYVRKLEINKKLAEQIKAFKIRESKQNKPK